MGLLLEALSRLVDPHSGGPLSLEITGAGDLPEGQLVGLQGRSYPLRLGIPSFLDAGTLNDQTVGSFNQKWARHRYYRDHTRGFYTQWFLDRYGYFEIHRLQECLSKSATILDAGTGSGRDALNFLENSSATVFAVDTSWEALAVARRQITDSRLVFVHADLHQLPMPDGFFDFINCDQVIHHTPSPRDAFEALSRKLKPGGQMCCYVYRKKSPIREFTDDYVRDRICHMPADEALALCEGFTRLGQTLTQLKLTINIEEDVPFLGIRKGPIDIQRLFHWHLMKCFWNDEFDFFTNNIINFDWYHPVHCHRYEPDEFRKWFDQGWEILAFDVQEAGISCRARRN